MKKEDSPFHVPAFATEVEEAAWWYANRERHAQALSATDDPKTLTREELLKRLAASKKRTPAPVIALRIPERDLALARKQAESRGLPYQTYIKSILHETLTARERRKST